MSIYDAAKDYLENTISKLGSAQKRCTELMINLTEHYEGSSIKQLSINNYEYRQDEGGDFYPNAAMVIFLRRLLKSFRLKCNLIGLWIRLYIAKRESLSSVLEDICTKPRR